VLDHLILTESSFFIQQATFCVNSLAHWLGDQPFDDRNSPRDHVITALVTLGEGYHKYAHLRLSRHAWTFITDCDF